MKSFKWLGILVAVVLMAALCVVPVSASPAVTIPVNTQGLFTSATPPTVTTQNATGTVINTNGQTAGYFHGTLTAKGTNDTLIFRCGSNMARLPVTVRPPPK